MSTKKILMLVGGYVEDYEVVVPFQTLSTAALDIGGSILLYCYPNDVIIPVRIQG
jgi:hypothetical protein